MKNDITTVTTPATWEVVDAAPTLRLLTSAELEKLRAVRPPVKMIYESPPCALISEELRRGAK